MRRFKIVILAIVLFSLLCFSSNLASLPPTFVLKNINGEIVPFQNNIPYPSFEPQPSHPRLYLKGVWRKARLPNADHNLSLSKRTPEIVEELRKELANLSHWQEITPSLIDNKYPDRYEGVVWYTKRFNLSSLPHKNAILVFLSANYITDVWLNGDYLGYHEGGYTPFAFDVSKHLKMGENILEVRVDNIPWGTRDDILPKGVCDWWNYGGIINDVYIEFLPQISILRLDLKPMDEKGKFRATALLWNKGEREEAISVKIACFEARKSSLDKDPSPKSIADRNKEVKVEGKSERELRLKAGEIKPIVFELRILNPKLWSPKEPNLYVVEAKIQKGDEFWNQFGFRFISVTNGNLLLNGKRVFLPGVCRHEDSLQGRTMDWETIRQDLDIIKDLGASFVRGTHYPNHPYTLIYADRIGLIFWEEIPIYWMGDREIENVLDRGIAQQMFLEMLYKDFSRPSLCFLGACNECGGNKRADLLRELKRLSQRVDGTRLMGQASVGQYFRDETQREADVLGFNFYWEVFYGGDAYSSTIEALEKMHSVFPDKPIIATEWGYWSTPDWGTIAKQLEIADKTFRAFTSKPYIVSALAWFLAFDYRTFLTNEGTFGLLTIDRKRHKPVYYLLREYYRKYSE